MNFVLSVIIGFIIGFLVGYSTVFIVGSDEETKNGLTCVHNCESF